MKLKKMLFLIVLVSCNSVFGMLCTPLKSGSIHRFFSAQSVVPFREITHELSKNIDALKKLAEDEKKIIFLRQTQPVYRSNLE